jgi:hypothetical protein
MRPDTLAWTAERVASGHWLDRALREFRDEFYLAPMPEQSSSMLLDEPPAKSGQVLARPATASPVWRGSQEPRETRLKEAGIKRRESALRSLAYLRGGFGERLPHVPDWAYSPRRYLDRASHASEIADDGMREYLTFSSPAEFASRNIFTEERPLRRARGPRPPETENR